MVDYENLNQSKLILKIIMSRSLTNRPYYKSQSPARKIVRLKSSESKLKLSENNLKPIASDKHYQKLRKSSVFDQKSLKNSKF